MAIDAFLVFKELGDGTRRMDGDSYDEYMDKKYKEAWALQLLSWNLGGALGEPHEETPEEAAQKQNAAAAATAVVRAPPGTRGGPAGRAGPAPGGLPKGERLLASVRPKLQPVVDASVLMKPPQFKALTITKEIDTASPALLYNMWFRNKIVEMHLLARKAGIVEQVDGTNLPAPSLIYIFKYVWINDVQWDSSDQSMATETVQFWFGQMDMTYKPQNNRGGILRDWTESAAVGIKDDVLKKLDSG